MTLKTRIIPILLWDGVQAVKTVQFKRPGRPVGSMMQHIQTMNARNVDELIILDINATLEGREPLYEKIKEFTNECYMPVTIGGGISKLEHIEKLLKAGADKVAIKTNYKLIEEAAKKFGSQSIIGVIEHLNYSGYINDKWVIHCENYAKILQNDGAGEILLTCIDYDGLKTGYSLSEIYMVSLSIKIPLIVNGGCGHPSHMLEAIQAGAHAVAASSLFLFTEWTPRDCAEYLKKHGVNTRI